MAELERETTEATETTATVASGRRRTTEDQPVITQDNNAGSKYRVGGKVTEESASESAKWSGEKMEESAS